MRRGVGAPTDGAPSGPSVTRNTSSMPEATAYPSLAVRLNARAVGFEKNSFVAALSAPIPLFMLIVLPVSSVPVARFTTDSTDWQLTLKRNGPLGEEPIAGTYARPFLIARLHSTFGKQPVSK